MFFLIFFVPLVNALYHEQAFLLVSTSSKLYSMKLPGPYHYDNSHELIYEETDPVNCWITDAFYVKAESLIYVNVYNSSSFSSQIFTLKRTNNGQWDKKVLYSDQNNCLGIAYNNLRKELYWTSGKAIVSGSSLEHKYQVLFNLDLAKKLLYVTYDPVGNNLYVSTLTYVYECPLGLKSDCRIIVRDLLSARGLFLDSLNRQLYVVDHKKKLIKRVTLKSDNSENEVETILNFEGEPEFGDVFYVTLFKNYIIWTEFSGKVKISNLDNLNTYNVLFSTNEYVYSVSLMDNSTKVYKPYRPSSHIPMTTFSSSTYTTTTTTSTTTTTKTTTTTTTTSTSTTTTATTSTSTTTTKQTTKAIESTSIFELNKEVEDESYLDGDDEADAPVFSQTSSSLYFTTSKMLNKIAHKVLKLNATRSVMVSSEKSTAIKVSSKLSAALYVIICLLCVSLVINMALVYVNKMKLKKQNSLVIQHEVRSNLTTTNDEHSASEQNECSINLINDSTNN
ncbi:hypothetical protein BpHYR1_029204 [Brachionus plicatilis]|uniref:Uncharacterized protein n=1 Tax=Brachionus plicatilis TaxID=10195 RepID=A0A3M7PN05_BRAPC|nr:hypothetical protein BpHYR1_029204 [Brachionus plicatilis]